MFESAMISEATFAEHFLFNDMFIDYINDVRQILTKGYKKAFSLSNSKL